MKQLLRMGGSCTRLVGNRLKQQKMQSGFLYLVLPRLFMLARRTRAHFNIQASQQGEPHCLLVDQWRRMVFLRYAKDINPRFSQQIQYIVFLCFLYAIVSHTDSRHFQLQRQFGLTVGITSQQKKILRNSCHSLRRIMWILQM